MMKISIMTVLLFLFGGNTVFACECYQFGGYSIECELPSADFIFEGKVVNLISEGGRVDAEFEVSNVLKGNIGKTFRINQTSNCSYPFKKDEGYLVYGQINKETKEIEATVCGRTKLLKEAKQEIEKIKTFLAQPDSQHCIYPSR